MVFIKFESPGTHLVSGPSMSGKTRYVFRVIKHKNEMFKIPPVKVRYAYSVWQPAFGELREKGVEFHEGLPSRETIEKWGEIAPSHQVLIIDDLMNQAVTSSDVLSLFTIHCHHMCISSFFLTQNPFPPGKFARSISLNAHYLTLFNTKRDRMQIQTLGRQIFPTQSGYFMEAYQDAAASRRYGYLVCDLHPATDKEFQLRTRVFPGEEMLSYTPLDTETSSSPHSFST